MSVTLYESAESRDLRVSPDGGEITLKYVATGSDDHAEVYLRVLLDTGVQLFGLIRKEITCRPQGGGLWFPEVVYGPGSLSEAIQAPSEEGAPPGGGESAAPPGGSGTDQPGTEPTEDEPLETVSVSGGGGTAHILLSKQTRFKVAANGGGVFDAKNAIGLTKDGVEGCDIVVPGGEISLTRKRRTVNLGYVRTLLRMTGTTNNGTWYGFARGELLYLGPELNGSQVAGWSIAHKFRFSENWPAGDPRCVINPQITLTDGKFGHEYVWCTYKDTLDVAAGEIYPLPVSAYVERVYDETDFRNLGVG